MEVQISYNELLRFLRNHANVDVSRLQIIRQSSRTLAISYDISDWVPTVTISVSVDKITEHHLYLSYDCSAAASMIISGVVSFLQSHLPELMSHVRNCLRCSFGDCRMFCER